MKTFETQSIPAEPDGRAGRSSAWQQSARGQYRQKWSSRFPEIAAPIAGGTVFNLMASPAIRGAAQTGTDLQIAEQGQPE